MKNYDDTPLDKSFALSSTAFACGQLKRICNDLSNKYTNLQSVKRSEQELLVTLNKEIANVMMCLSDLVDEGVISNESIESVIISKNKQIKL